MIVITGGAGFIGSNILAALQKQGKEVVISDRLRSNEKWQNICKRRPVEVIPPESIQDYLDLHKSNVEFIIHMGAISTTTETNADLIFENNYRLTVFLYNWCAENNIRFIYASSAATYGDGSLGFEDIYTTEHLDKFRPLNAYAWSKHWVDRKIILSQESGDRKPPQCVGLKFFNVYGPNELHKGPQQSVISHVFRTIQKEGKPAKLFKSYKEGYPDGGQMRDFIWVGDCVRVILWFMEQSHVSGIFNVGTGKARSFLDLANAVYRAIEKKPEIEFIDMPNGLAEKYQYFTQASMDNLRQAGYEVPFTSLEEGVQTYVQDYLSQDDPYL